MKNEKLLTFTDSNWGAQDVSSPQKDVTRTMVMEEMKSIQGYYITQKGRSITMGVCQEKLLSGSSCIPEIKAMHEGVKDIQFL